MRGGLSAQQGLPAACEERAAGAVRPGCLLALAMQQAKQGGNQGSPGGLCRPTIARLAHDALGIGPAAWRLNRHSVQSSVRGLNCVSLSERRAAGTTASGGQSPARIVPNRGSVA